MTRESGLAGTMKILASIYVNGSGNACMPTTTPLAVRTAGQSLNQGKHLIAGEIVCIAGTLTLVVHSASPAADLQEFMVCAAIPDRDGIIESACLVCSFNGPFVGKLTDIAHGEVFFESIITSDTGEAILLGGLSVASADAARDEDAVAVDSNECEGQVVARSYTPVGTNRIVITSPPLGIMFPDEPGPCSGLCAPLNPTTKHPKSPTVYNL